MNLHLSSSHSVTSLISNTCVYRSLALPRSMAVLSPVIIWVYLGLPWLKNSKSTNEKPPEGGFGVSLYSMHDVIGYGLRVASLYRRHFGSSRSLVAVIRPQILVRHRNDHFLKVFIHFCTGLNQGLWECPRH